MIAIAFLGSAFSHTNGILAVGFCATALPYGRAIFLKAGTTMPFEHYIEKGGRKLRYGYTTGSCAALATKAATQMLLMQEMVSSASLTTPKGMEVTVEVQNPCFDSLSASCAVEKDAGDDPDITHRQLIYATVVKQHGNGIIIDGGSGVGRVTRPGLDQPVGAAAINSTPRQMIAAQAQEICDCLGYDGGLKIVISVPNGEKLAQKTFNPQLGIQGGISILGTTGIVEPQSMQALIDCIQVELKAYQAEGISEVVFTPGNYGEAFLEHYPNLQNPPTVKCSNFIGESIDFAKNMGFQKVLLVGHIGKFVKLAGGMMNTHSQYGDCRVEIFTAHAALAGADPSTIALLMNSATADDCIAILKQASLWDMVLNSLLAKIHHHAKRRAGENLMIGAVLYSNHFGLLGMTTHAPEIIESLHTQKPKGAMHE